jgi:hypothetical protein
VEGRKKRRRRRGPKGMSNNSRRIPEEARKRKTRAGKITNHQEKKNKEKWKETMKERKGRKKTVRPLIWKWKEK